MSDMETQFGVMHNMVNQLKNKYDQIANLSPKVEGNSEIAKQIKSLLTKMKNWDDEMVQRLSKAYDDVENFENKFTAEWLFLINQTESDIPVVNQGSMDRYAELSEQWDKLSGRGNQMLSTDIPDLNKALWKAGIGAIWQD